MKKLFLPVLMLGGVLGAARFAYTQSADDVMALANYRVALDQVASGNLPSARLLLETSRKTGEMAPESAALLAYLEEKAGDSNQARQTLQGVAAPTALTSAYLVRLGGAPTPVEVATQAENARRGGNPARLESTDARIIKLEKVMWQLVNNDRAAQGLDALSWDDDMASVARAHSAEMRDKRYFAHESPTSGLVHPLDRYKAGVGGAPRVVAENVYKAEGDHSLLTDSDIHDAEDAFMKSQGHRENILYPAVSRIGIGICSDATGNIWVTQLFASR